MGTQPGPSSAESVAAICRRALPQVYGYVLPRCGSTALAEDLTAETFMAAVAAVKQDRVGAAEVTVAWLVAGYLGRSVHATETLLVRARAALRRIYREEGSDNA